MTTSTSPVDGGVTAPVDGAAGTSPAEPTTPTTDWQAEHNKTAAALRKERERVASLEKEKRDREAEEAAKSGNSEKLREGFETQLTAKDSEIKKLTEQLHSVIVEKEVRSIAAKHAVDADDVWRIIGSDFDVEPDSDGKPRAVVKDSPVSIEKHILTFLEKKPHLAKNPRAAGSGTNSGGSTANGGSVPGMPANFEQLPKKEQRDWFAKNPTFKLGG